MIAFGSSMTSPEIFARRAQPGIRLAAESDSPVFAYQAAGSISRSYNLIREKAGAFDDLEALVLVHQDAEIVAPDFCGRLRRVLRDPEVGLVGCAGAIGTRSIAWWEAPAGRGVSIYRYGEWGGGEMPIQSQNGEHGEVDTLDGFVLALSPWVVRNVEFDESLGMLHGFDFDYCLQVRAAGRKVVTADLGVVHHHSLDLVTDNEPWVAAHMRVAEKWEGRLPDAGANADDWRRRARRAEAEAAAARLEVAARQLQRDARARAGEERLEQVTETLSWRLTEPLRRLNARRRARSRASSAEGLPGLPQCAWCGRPLDSNATRLPGRVRCAACGVASTDPWPSEAELEAAYGGAYRPRSGRFSGIGDAVLRRTRGRLARRLDRIAPAGPVLDVGAGDGALLDALAAAGRAAVGVEREPSRPDVRSGDLAAIGGEWAAIVFWHSLEHLPRPGEELGRAAAMLAPGGVLVVAVPNAGSLQARLLGERWLALDLPRHLVHLPAEALLERLRSLGLTVERVSFWRGGQVVFGWLHGLVGALPGRPDLYDAIRRPEARSRPISARSRALALAAGAVLAPVAAVGAAAEIASRRGGTVYVEARRA